MGILMFWRIQTAKKKDLENNFTGGNRDFIGLVTVELASSTAAFILHMPVKPCDVKAQEQKPKKTAKSNTNQHLWCQGL